LKAPLLPMQKQKSPSRGITPRVVLLCGIYVLLSASGPILLDWVKTAHGGRFRFSTPALTFHAFGFAALLGIAWTAANNKWKELLKPDMLWRFFITAAMFAAGDIMSFTSMQYIDPGTFSLVGKAFAIVLTVLFSRIFLGKKQTTTQYALVIGVVVATVAFCQTEASARTLELATGAQGHHDIAIGRWLTGLTFRTCAVGLTSLGAVIQEKLLNWEQGGPFLVQQVWMGLGAMTMSLFSMKFLHGQSLTSLVHGFDDWRVLVLLVMYTATGLTTGLMVKRLGAVAKALCVPVYLGGCYAYAVYRGSAALTFQVVAAWAASTFCILMFAVTKAKASRTFGGATKDR